MPHTRRFVSVGTKLTVSTLLVLGVVFGGAFVGLSRFAQRQLTDAKVLAAEMTTSLFLRTVAAPVLFEDKKGIASSLELMSKDTEVLAVQLWDGSPKPGVLLASHVQPGSSGVEPVAVDSLRVERAPDRLVLRGPVRDPDGQIIAVAAVQYSLAREQLSYEHVRMQFLSTGASVAAALTVLLLSLTWRWTIRPINVLLDGVRQLEEGKPLVLRARFSHDELGRLSIAFRGMADAVLRREHDIRELNAGLEARVKERTAEIDEKNRVLEDNLEQLRATQQKLVDTSRKVGMAEVATSVLHNVGNVLNSVNVSASVVGNLARESKAAGLTKATALLKQQADPGRFLNEDPRGKKLIDYFDGIAQALDAERARTLEELVSLTKNIDHIKVIVKMQQSHAKPGSALERMSLVALVEDALKFDAASYDPTTLRIVRDFEEIGDVETDRHKLLQIVMNLLSNARHAVDGCAQRVVTVRIRSDGAGRAKLEVADTGTGIPRENLDRIFNHGFTTKRDGHGFGLHSCANAASELGGTMRVHSDGPGHGATFTVVIPTS